MYIPIEMIFVPLIGITLFSGFKAFEKDAWVWWFCGLVEATFFGLIITSL